MQRAIDILNSDDQEMIWNRYCSFFDLNIEDFQKVQTSLLEEHLTMIRGTKVADRLLPVFPQTVSEFRETASITSYEDYAEFLDSKDEEAIGFTPVSWGMTSGRSGRSKWIPYSKEFIRILEEISIAVVIAACSEKKYQVRIKPGFRVLLNLPPAPYLTGVLLDLLANKIGAEIIPPVEEYKDADFETKIKDGFSIALKDGVEFLSSLTSVLVRMGDRFVEQSGGMKLNPFKLPLKVLIKLVFAKFRSSIIERRPLLPKDLWKLKGLSCYGMDTSLYRDKIEYYWGKVPFESYGATEFGVLAIHGWNKNNLVPVPNTCFLEFLPVGAELEAKNLVLAHEIVPGNMYEIVITSFYGMPLVRYRMGDIVECVGLSDKSAGIALPQLRFAGRISDIIDLAGFARLDESTIHRAILSAEIEHSEWSAVKDLSGTAPRLHVYIEPKSSLEVRNVKDSLHKALCGHHGDFANLEVMLGIDPLKVTVLPVGAFQRYYENRKSEGASMAHLKPPHMNPSAKAIDLLVSAE